QEEIQLSEGSGEQEPEQEKQEPWEQPETQAQEELEQQKESEDKPRANTQEDRGSFVHGLAVGLGLGCISTFIILWIAVFFTPHIPSTLTYETLLSVFIYPMLYLLAVGLVALTAGIVREYYVRK
ncbi:MAG: hypothetical protein ACP5LB_07585, partial [Candidatus Bathyarchaeia archaeon]